MNSINKKGVAPALSSILSFFRSHLALSALILIMVAMPFLNDRFLSKNNITQLLFQSSVLIIIAAGVTFVILSGASNLAVGAIMCTSGIAAVMLQSYVSLGLSLVAVLIIGALQGALCGFFVAYLRLNAFITTLGFQMFYRGVNLVITDAQQIQGTNEAYLALGTGRLFGVIPYVFIAAVAVTLLSHFVLTRTSFGRNCYAVGGDYDVAKYSGIPVKRQMMSVFTISGILAALGGFFLSARMNTASASFGDLTSLLVNCGVVVGGTSFSGGVGGALNTFIGLFFLGALENAMQQLALNVYIQQLAQGSIIVLILGFGCYARKRKLEDV